MVAEDRNYQVLNTEQAKEIVWNDLTGQLDSMEYIAFGLPEINDRYDIWNVPVLYKEEVIGEVAVDAYSKKINVKRSSDICVLKGRIDKVNRGEIAAAQKRPRKKETYRISELSSKLIKGRSELVLKQFPEQCVDMIFTSPPYYNARKQYSEYDTYEDYLAFIRRVVKECRRVLMDGKFFIINSSHVLVPRASRNESSSRIAVPFDIHQIFLEEGFEFVDDIIWQKPEGAGWASGRGRRFSADRNPMQYKAVPVTEYVMVYRKKPAVLIDYFIRNHPSPEIIRASKIGDGYEKTNVWYLSPARDKRHPAVFPKELAERVITYYSFKNDVVLDPFGGIGTTAKAAAGLDRRFISIECSGEYAEAALADMNSVNTFVNPVEFEFCDCSSLTDSPEKSGYGLHELIKMLEKKGVSGEEVADLLRKEYKDTLHGNGQEA